MVGTMKWIRMNKLLPKIKGKKDHTFSMVYENEYCDVNGLVLVEVLEQHPMNDCEGASEAKLVKQLDVFGK